jgi:hypothetical protein
LPKINLELQLEKAIRYAGVGTLKDCLMPSSSSIQQNARFDRSPQKMPSAAESAAYSYDVLGKTRRAEQTKLARLIEAAAEEARAIVGTKPR